MKVILADKIASVAQHNDLHNELRLSSNIPCEEGVLIAAKILNNKSRYNRLELVSGRMSSIQEGDIIVGSLGHRNALLGYSGSLPNQLEVGSIVQILNMGGVMGICKSYNPDVGPPFDCEVIGSVLSFPYLGERVGITSRVGLYPYQDNTEIKKYNIPVIVIAGTCMDSGKTVAACSLISRLRQMNLSVNACKATGISLRRDILAMEDAGASRTMIFSDFGVVSTSAHNASSLTKLLLNHLSEDSPDIIVIELGDGLMGSYGVESILKDKVIKNIFSSVILCANDPVAAWGGTKLLRENYNIEPSIITGPATDNTAGSEIIYKSLNLRAINALSDGQNFGIAAAESIKSTSIGQYIEY